MFRAYTNYVYTVSRYLVLSRGFAFVVLLCVLLACFFFFFISRKRREWRESNSTTPNNTLRHSTANNKETQSHAKISVFCCFKCCYKCTPTGEQKRQRSVLYTYVACIYALEKNPIRRLFHFILSFSLLFIRACICMFSHFILSRLQLLLSLLLLFIACCVYVWLCVAVNYDYFAVHLCACWCVLFSLLLAFSVFAKYSFVVIYTGGNSMFDSAFEMIYHEWKKKLRFYLLWIIDARGNDIFFSYKLIEIFALTKHFKLAFMLLL